MKYLTFKTTMPQFFELIDAEIDLAGMSYSLESRGGWCSFDSRQTEIIRNFQPAVHMFDEKPIRIRMPKTAARANENMRISLKYSG